MAGRSSIPNGATGNRPMMVAVSRLGQTRTDGMTQVVVNSYTMFVKLHQVIPISAFNNLWGCNSGDQTHDAHHVSMHSNALANITRRLTGWRQKCVMVYLRSRSAVAVNY